MKRDYKVLELDKILELLASETSCEGAAKIARGIEPSSDLGEARRRMEDTAAAMLLTARFGSPSFGQLKDVTDVLRRAEAGASLSMRELLDIAETLRIIRSMRGWFENCTDTKTCLDDRFNAYPQINIWRKR